MQHHCRYATEYDLEAEEYVPLPKVQSRASKTAWNARPCRVSDALVLVGRRAQAQRSGAGCDFA